MTLLEILRPLTSQSAQHRGWQYLNRVHALTHDAQSVAAEVHGSEVYDVEIRTDSHHLRVWCSCPYFADRSSGCKHLWATAVLATENGWLTTIPAPIRVVMDFAGGEDLEFGVLDDEAEVETVAPDPVPSARPLAIAPAPEWAVALAAVTPATEELASDDSQAELRYVLTAPVRATVTELPLTIEHVERRGNGGWSKPRPSALTLDEVPHLADADDRWALSLVYATRTHPRPQAWHPYEGPGHTAGPAYVNGPMLDVLLPRLCPTGRVRLRTSHRNVPTVGPAEEPALSWDRGEAWRFVLVVDAYPAAPAPEPHGGTEPPSEFEPEAYRVDAVLERGAARISVHQFALLTDTIAVLDGVAARFESAGGFAWAAQLRARGALVIPGASRRALIESLARSAVEHVELPDLLRWEERGVAPRFGVTIGRPDEGSGACPIELLAHYDDTTAPLGQGSSRLLSDDGRVMFRRNRAAEAEALETLRDHGVVNVDAHLRRGASIHYRKVAALVRALVDANWLVLADGLRYRALEAPRLRISSGIDWFEIKTLSEAGTPVDLRDLMDALKTGRRTVALGDGTVGMLPEQWLARVAPVLALGDAGPAGVRFKPSQVALIDALLAAQPHVNWDEGFERAREAVRRFERVSPEDPPATFCGELRDYQRESLGWMRFLRDFGFGGCLADDMGLGKTVMVLAMLDARRADRTGPHKPSLVVMPRSLIFNWTSEAARFTPRLRVMDFAHAERAGATDALAEADLVFITYGTLRRDVAALQHQAFDYVVLDEAQAIKNAGTATAKAVRLLRADHRLALTGTPIENHLGELYSLFEFLNPGLLGSGRVLDARRLAGNADSPGYMARLATGLRPFFLRRTKEHVTPELPSRTEETLYCELEGEQYRTYEQLRQHYRLTLLRKIDRDGLVKSRFEILEALLRLRQAACHTGLLPGRIAGHSAKFDLLLPRLGELVAEGRKALVFSQFTSLLTLLRQRLDAEKVTYEYLDGKTRDRKAHVARFQDDPSCSLFLLSLKAGGVGLNLTSAEYVFLLDPWWNPAVEMQAIDRTHRIGQVKPVFAYRLVARETVEERILELQSHKRALADAILDAGTAGLRGLQREDLEQLLA